MVLIASSNRDQESQEQVNKESSQTEAIFFLHHIYRPQATMVFLKVTDGNETHRFQITSELTFDQLRERLIRLFPHCKNGIVIMRSSLLFWLQMIEPITHMDTDNYMTIHHKGTSYFDSTAHLMFCLLV